ncbi:hypothetical protein Tco_0365501 [Tanacetum coccineum]
MDSATRKRGTQPSSRAESSVGGDDLHRPEKRHLFILSYEQEILSIRLIRLSSIGHSLQALRAKAYSLPLR